MNRVQLGKEFAKRVERALGFRGSKGRSRISGGWRGCSDFDDGVSL